MLSSAFSSFVLPYTNKKKKGMQKFLHPFLIVLFYLLLNCNVNYAL